MIVCTLIASALICNDYGLCLKQMKLVRMKNSVIENGKHYLLVAAAFDIALTYRHNMLFS